MFCERTPSEDNENSKYSVPWGKEIAALGIFAEDLLANIPLSDIVLPFFPFFLLFLYILTSLINT